MTIYKVEKSVSYDNPRYNRGYTNTFGYYATRELAEKIRSRYEPVCTDHEFRFGSGESAGTARFNIIPINVIEKI